MSNKNIEIVYQDDDILVANKPDGISVTPDRAGTKDLLPILQKQLQTDQPLRPVHRLDKSVSGAILIAKTPEAQSKHASWFDKNIIKHTYLALISGAILENSGVIDTPMSHSRKNPRIMIIDTKRGKPAITKWRALANFGIIALFAVDPETIRTHQVRLHLASINLPLVIDPLYAGTRPVLLSDFKDRYRLKGKIEEKPLIERLTLHSYQLEIPVGDAATRKITAKPEKRFAATIKMLAKHNPHGADAILDEKQFQAVINALPI